MTNLNTFVDQPTYNTNDDTFPIEYILIGLNSDIDLTVITDASSWCFEGNAQFGTQGYQLHGFNVN